ncbi:hypothetical protein IWW42_004696, partial [Coemansia sp. RSA 1085]
DVEKEQQQQQQQQPQLEEPEVAEAGASQWVENAEWANPEGTAPAADWAAEGAANSGWAN